MPATAAAELTFAEELHSSRDFSVDNAQVWCYTLEHMFERAMTAFKHPGCGGVIYAYRRRGLQRFRCEACGRWAEDLAELALGPMNERSAKTAEESPAIDADASNSAVDTE